MHRRPLHPGSVSGRVIEEFIRVRINAGDGETVTAVLADPPWKIGVDWQGPSLIRHHIVVVAVVLHIISSSDCNCICGLCLAKRFGMFIRIKSLKD